MMIRFYQYNCIFDSIISKRIHGFKNVRTKYQYTSIDKINYLNKKVSKHHLAGYPMVTAAIPVVFFGLAIWQIYRKKWKDTLVEDLRLKTHLPAIDLPLDVSDRSKLEYRRVRVRGSFDHSREIYLGPRSLLKDNQFAERLPSFYPFTNNTTNIGYCIVTPFKLADRNLEILVNRGWVPQEKLDPRTRTESQIEGEIELEGVIRLKENKPVFVNENQPHKRKFTHRDIVSMAETAGTSFVFIDAVADYDIPGGPAGGQTQIHVKNKHMEYIITWSVLAVMTSHMWYKRWIKRVN